MIDNYFRFEHVVQCFDGRDRAQALKAFAAVEAFAIECLMLDGKAPRGKTPRGRTVLEERLVSWRPVSHDGPWRRHLLVGQPREPRLMSAPVSVQRAHGVLEAADAADDGDEAAAEAADRKEHRR